MPFSKGHEQQASSPLTSKPHYPILDGLRGVGSLMVVCFHLLEAHSTNHLDQIINHGYLAVDFFFALSGFVIGYAYDDRWGKLSVCDFFKRRLIRLQPMVAIGSIIGALFFYFQDSSLWPMIHTVPIWQTLGIMLIGMTLLPIPTSIDIRGKDEMHPLNGPAWTLFFEYIANILYALVIRKFSTKNLSLLLFFAGCSTVHLALTSPKGDIIGGWSLTLEQLHVGFTRLMYPFCAGLLLSRIGKFKHIKHTFLLCSLMIVICLSIPRIGGSEHLWANGIYDSFCIIFVFPLILFLGASGELEGKYAAQICKIFGDISYPIYITHYPLLYVYTGWVADTKRQFSETWGVALLVLLSALFLAYFCLKLFDEPARRWLNQQGMESKVK